MRKRLSLQTLHSPRASELTRGGRWATRLVFFLPLLVFVICAVLSCVRINGLLFANLSPIVAAEATRQTGHETRLGRVHFSVPGVLSIENVALSSRATFALSHGEAVLSADRLTVHYDPRALLFDSGNPVHALGDVVLDRPSILVERLSKTRFNFSDILQKPGQPKRKPFVGQVIARDSTVRFRDYLAPARLGARPALNALVHVNATVNLHSERTAYFTSDGQGTASRLASFHLSGDTSRVLAGRFRVATKIMDADAAYWAGYFASSHQGYVTAGRADLDITAARLGSKPPPGLPVDLLGRITIRRAAVALTMPQLRRVSVRDVNGSATFTGSGLTFNATAALADQPVAADGTFFDFARPEVAIQATSSKINAERLVRALPPMQWPSDLRLAPGAVTLNIVGPAGAPTVGADVALPAAQYGENRVVNVRAAVDLVGKTLTIPSLVFQTPGGGAADLRGTILLGGKTPSVRLAGQARGVNLAALRLPGGALSKLNLGGLADVQMLADSVGRPLRLVANVTVARPRIGRTQLDFARARLVYVKGQGLALSRALIRAPQGALLASGVVPIQGKAGKWDLAVDAAGLNLAALAGPYTQAPVGGLAYFRGRVEGSAASPRAMGTVQLINPRYARYTADVVRGGLTASMDSLRLDDLVLNQFPTEAHVSGTVSRLASSNPALDLNVRLSQADVQDFLDVVNQFTPGRMAVPGRRPAQSPLASLPPITGTAEGTFQIGGSARSPRIAAKVAVTDATVGPYRVDELHTQGYYAADTLRVETASLQGEGASVTARGTLALKTGRVQAAFTADQLNLERIRSLTVPYADVSGILGLSGRVGGTLRDPAAWATLTANGLRVDGQTFAPLTVSGRYADGSFVKTGDPLTFDIRPPTPGGHDIRYVINAFRLTLPTPLHPKRPPSFALDAAIPADAPENVPHVLQTLRDSRFAATPAGLRLLHQIASLPRPLDGAFFMPNLVASGPLDAPAVQVTIRANGLTLGTDHLNTLAADMSFADPKDPKAHLSLTGENLRVSGVSVSDIAARASLADHVVTLETLRATSARAFLEASGRADLRGNIYANLDAAHIPLSLLNPWLPQKIDQTRALTGELSSLSVSATGRTQAPDLTASLNLADPGLALGVPGKPVVTAYSLDRIRSGAITLTTAKASGAQVLAITDLAAFKNGRPVASLSGALPFRWRGEKGPLPGLPDGEPLHAQLTAPDLSILAPFLPALDPKRTTGTLTASLDVKGAGNSRRLSGTLDLVNGGIGLKTFDTALTQLTSHLALTDDRFTIQRLSAASSKGGTLAVTGDGTLQKASLRVTANNLTVDENSRQTLLSQTYGSAFRGKINGSLDVAGPWLTPQISTPTGAPLLISDASGTIPSASPTPASPAGPPVFDPVLAVRVLLGRPDKTITISNALLRANASGSVDLTGQLSAPQVRADLAITRGQFILPPATRLNFVRSPQGNMVYVRYPEPDPSAYNQPGLRTVVDLTAQASVSLSQEQLAAYRPAVSNGVGGEAAPVGNAALTASSFSQPQRYTITAHIHGALNDPNLQIDLESSPPGLSRQDMLVALTGVAGLQGLAGSDAQAAFQQELSQALYSIGVPTLLTPLEESIAQSLSLTDFDVAYSPDSGGLVTLGKQIAPHLEVTYLRSFGSRVPGAVNSLTMPPEYTVKLSYGLTRRLQVSVSTDDQRNNTVALEGVLGF